MNSLDGFLEKFKTFLTAQGASKKTVVAVVKTLQVLNFKNKK
jgi:hypothetical protein